MDSEHFYLEEGFPFHGRKLEKLKVFLSQNDLSYDTQIQYTVLLKTQDGELAGPFLSDGLQGLGVRVQLVQGVRNMDQRDIAVDHALVTGAEII